MNTAIIKEDVESVTFRLASLCKVLDNRRIFLIGGTGFFGTWLLHNFLGLRNAQGLDVAMTVLSRDPKGFLDSCPEFVDQPGLDFIAGDVRSFTPPSRRPKRTTPISAPRSVASRCAIPFACRSLLLPGGFKSGRLERAKAENAWSEQKRTV
jgi:hypothetical protein